MRHPIRHDPLEIREYRVHALASFRRSVSDQSRDISPLNLRPHGPLSQTIQIIRPPIGGLVRPMSIVLLVHIRVR